MLLLSGACDEAKNIPNNTTAKNTIKSLQAILSSCMFMGAYGLEHHGTHQKALNPDDL